MKIKHLITIGIVLLALIASVASASILIVSGGQSINISPLYKGLVGHWKLDSDSEKVGSELLSNGAFATTNGIVAPEGFVVVPGSSTYGTEDFAVAKYEMKNVGGVATSQAADTPWVSISQTDSITECSALGSKYHLITNDEWMTTARNAEQVASNWSGGSVGSGDFARGWAAHTSYGDAWTNTAAAPTTDSDWLYNTAANTGGSTGTHLYRRTHTLSNGEEIWDLSGNVWEWNSDTIACAAAQCTTSEMPYDSTPASEWIEFTALNTYGELSYDKIRPSNSSWSSTEDLGRVYTDYNAASGSNNTHAFRRGGRWDYGAYAGVFTLTLSAAPASTGTDLGFRCSYTIWDRDKGWTIDSDKASFDATAGSVSAGIKQTPSGFPSAGLAGKSYILNYEITANTLSGGATNVLEVEGGTTGLGATTINIDSTVGKHSQVFVYDSANTSARLNIRNKDATAGAVSITNVSVKEIQTADTTPNANHGVVYGATQNTSDMSFDGTADYIQLADTQVMVTDTSLAYWAKINTKDYSGIVGYSAGGTSYLRFGQSTGTENNRIYGETDVDGDAIILDFDGAIAYDTWHHFIIVQDGDVWRLYLDGSLQSDTDSSSTDLTFSRIGQGRGGADYMDGSIKDMRFYDRVLSSTEISQLYSLGGRQNNISVGSLYKGLVGHWKLDSESEKVGDEKVVNGTFDSATTGWLASVSNISSVAGGVSGNCLEVENSGASYGYAYDLITTVVGKTYRHTYYFKKGTDSGTIRLGTSAGGAEIYNSTKTDVEWTQYVKDFTATTTSTYIRVGNASNTSGKTTLYDNISIKELESADTTPYANHGVVYGATQNSDSMTFSGSDNHIQFDSKVNLGTEHTISIWHNDDNSGADNSLFGNDGDYTGIRFSSVDSLEYRVDSDYDDNANGSITRDGNWHNLVISRISLTNINIYQDGVYLNNITGYSNTDDFIIDLIGIRNASSLDFIGDIKDVRLYNRALSAQEIELLYKQR